MIKNLDPVKAVPLPSLLTAQQAAKILQVGINTIYKWVDEGRIPYLDFGAEGHRRCLRFKPDDLEKFIQDHSRN